MLFYVREASSKISDDHARFNFKDMQKFSLFTIVIPCLVFFIHLLITSCHSFTCVHDALSEMSQNEYGVSDPESYKIFKQKRQMEPKLFEPLSMHSYFGKFDPAVTDNAVYNIRMALNKVKVLLSQLFQVKKVKKPFLLDRTCAKMWDIGHGRNRCARYIRSPEMCSVADIKYVIPDKFLKGIDVYDFSNPTPRFVASPGEGVPDANFLLFIVSRSSSFCQQEDVQAYGRYCKMDKTNRPVAGILNICPEYFSQRIYRKDHYFHVMLHEVFHILGFSHDLFEKFKVGSEFGSEGPKHIIERDTFGIDRLVFPLVAQNAIGHFQCFREGFGAPMDSVQNGNETNKWISSSHWHPLLMYSSIMTPSFSDDEYLVVDIITLALFDSTGWYIVNYTNADAFVFGKGEGCKFGLTDKSCQESKFLCPIGL